MVKKKQVDWKVVSIGLVCLTVIECFALANGINGKVLSTVLMLIALAIGITIPRDLIPFKLK